ncbi:MAG: hypothetical protein QGI83_00495 [Candidatus Latescibacteria bacterium]|jgi:hypothetical protein|nr:hypothetical protein [Candidatus Latescibacterota bacterium]
MMKASILSAPRFPSLAHTRPSMPALTSPRAITSDANGTANSQRAAGMDLISKSLASTSQINGRGGRLDVLG